MDEQSNQNKTNTTQKGKYVPRSNNNDLSNYVFGKVQPQAVPLEEAVLGAVMLDKDALTVVLDILKPESFYTDANQAIYRAMLRLFEKSQPIDLLTVTEELKKGGDLEKIGGAYYLVELTNRVASAANIEYHARIVSQKHIQRELIRVSTSIIRDAYEDTTDVFQLMDEAEQHLFGITEHHLTRSFESISGLTGKLLKQIEELSKKEDGLTGVPTGFSELDRVTSGWQSSDLVIMAARPGMGKCLAKGTQVVLFNGSLKKVEEVVAGDLLMGDDSTPRRVLGIARGKEKMYWIRQEHGIDYRVNESHILSLKPRGGSAICNISVHDYLAQPDSFKENHKGYKVAIDFQQKALPLSPYLLGLWLGDASRLSLEEMYSHAGAAHPLLHHPAKIQKGGGETLSSGQDVSLRELLDLNGLLSEKKIPQDFLFNDTHHRLLLLAGLLDGNPHFFIRPNGFEIALANEALCRQIKFLCDSLGFRTSLKSRAATRNSTFQRTVVFRLGVTGDIQRIPMKIRKGMDTPLAVKTDWLQTSIRVEYDKEDYYYGFELDGNGLFLLEDCTVTHNTSLILALARNAALEFNRPVAIFSLEMANLQLVQRLVSMEAEIPMNKLRNGQLEEYEWQQLQTAIERMSNAPIFIDDTPGLNIFELRAKCRRLRMQHKIEMVIIDYLQLMSGSGEGNRGGNREQEVSAISRALKGLAKELNVPVIALSQLSRAVETRGGSKRPQLSDLRESGSIEQDADMVAFIYRPEYYQIMEDEEGQSLKGVAEVIIAKHRNGSLGTVKLRFIDHFAKFTDLDDPHFNELPFDTFTDPAAANVITRPSRMNDEDIPF